MGHRATLAEQHDGQRYAYAGNIRGTAGRPERYEGKRSSAGSTLWSHEQAMAGHLVVGYQNPDRHELPVSPACMTEASADSGYILGTIFIALAALDIMLRRSIDSFIGLPLRFLAEIGWPTTRWQWEHRRQLLSRARVARVIIFGLLGTLVLTLTWISGD